MTEVVTTHALYRWLTRIKGIRRADMVLLTDPMASDMALARAGCEMLGLTVQRAEGIICPARCLPAIKLGVHAIRLAEWTLICRDGVVATVVEGKPGHITGQHRRVGGKMPGRRQAARRADLREPAE